MGVSKNVKYLLNAFTLSAHVMYTVCMKSIAHYYNGVERQMKDSSSLLYVVSPIAVAIEEVLVILVVYRHQRGCSS